MRADPRWGVMLVVAAWACRPDAPATPTTAPDDATSPGEVVAPESEPGEPIGDEPPADVAENEACEVINARLLEEMCGEEPDPECTGDVQLHCEERLDLDGDGQEDVVRFALAEEAVFFHVRFGKGEEKVLSEPFEFTELPELGQPWPAPSDERYPAELSWLAAWSVAKREGDELVRAHRFPAGPALGDGLWLSGTDAAAMLMLSERGWLLVQLGY